MRSSSPVESRSCTTRSEGRRSGVITCRRACWRRRSITVGMPRSRTPPPGLGISTRLTGVGLYVPARSSAFTVSQCVSGKLVARLPLHRPRRGLLRSVPLACRRAEGCSLSSISPASRSGLRERKGRLVPAKSSALRHTLAASPLLFAGSSLAGYSAVFALRANASVSSLLSVRPFRFPASRTRVLWPLLTPADSAQPLGCGYEVTSRIPQASPDKSVIFPPATTGVYRTSPWRLRISLCLATHPTNPASNPVRVPWPVRLPPASFRFGLATDTLALG